MPSTDSHMVAMLPAPPGYAVDFNHPLRRHDIVNITYFIWGLGMVLSCLFLAQRLYVKLTVRKKFGLDDGLF